MSYSSIEGEVARAIWGAHEEAADCSHRPEHVRSLFLDANASHRLARAMLEALTSGGRHVFTDAELRAYAERIIRATDDHMSNVFLACTPDTEQIDAIIAAAEEGL